MAVQTSGSLAKLLVPGLRKVIMQTYDEHPKIFSQIFYEFESQRSFEEMINISGYPLFQDKSEDGGITYVSQSQGFTTRLQPKTKALGIAVTMEEIQDNLYKEVAAQRTKLLRFSHLQTLEYDAHYLLSNAFSSSIVYGDGTALINSAHPLIGASGGTFSNILPTAAPFSEAALEDLIVQIGLAVNDDGFKVHYPLGKLIVHESNKFNVARIYKTLAQPGTNNNDVNALMSTNCLPEPVITPYLASANPWFVTTKLPTPEQGLVLVNRMPLDLVTDNDADTRNAKWNMVCRYVFGAVDTARCIFGSNAQ
jgi:hypothetical protein